MIDEEKAKELGQKIKKAEFDYNDFLDQMHQIKKMGGMASIMSMMPGMGQLKGWIWMKMRRRWTAWRRSSSP